MTELSAFKTVLPSCSFAEFFAAPSPPTSAISNSASLPDINAILSYDLVGTILSSWQSHPARKKFAEGKKFRSPVSIAWMVVKAQFLDLRRRIHALEVEKDTLKHVNVAYQSKINTFSQEISRLRAEYNTLLLDRRKLQLMTEHDQQKIRSLTSDIDNAQQFIMAMVDIKLHENFLQVAADETLRKGVDAEKSLAKAIADEADRNGSLWSKILSLLVDAPTANTYSATVDLALSAKNKSSPEETKRGMGPKPVKVSASIPAPHIRTQEGRRNSDPTSVNRGGAKPGISSEGQPPMKLNGSRPPLSPSRRHASAPTEVKPLNPSGVAVRSNCGTHPPAHSTTDQARKILRTRTFLVPKVSDVKLKSTRMDKSYKKKGDVQRPPTHNLEKRKDMIINSDVSIPKNVVKTKTPIFTALNSLERICALLSSSDLGSLEETSDDDDGPSRASDRSNCCLHQVKTGKLEASTADGRIDVGAAICQDSDNIDCPGLSPSISTSPPSTPPILCRSLSINSDQTVEISPTLTEFSDTTSIAKQEPVLYETSIRSSLNLRFPAVSRIARRLSRVTTKIENHNGLGGAFSGSASPSPPKKSHISSGLPTPSIKTASKVTKSSSALPSEPTAHQRSNFIPTLTKTRNRGKTVPFISPDTANTNTFINCVRETDKKPEPQSTILSKTPQLQESKFSVGRTFLRRFSNIPGSVSKTLESIQSNTGPSKALMVHSPAAITAIDVASKPKAITLESPIFTAASSFAGNTSAVATHKTKPRSNTVNSYSPTKSSPLSRNVVTASSGSHNSTASSWRRSSIQTVISTPTTSNSGGTTRAANRRASDTVPTPQVISETKPFVKCLNAKNGESESPGATPTAAFMKPVNKSSKVAKRMTNSIKPLIPTWSIGPSTSQSPTSPCGDDMFRNSLSMVVR